jgi:anoctamin-10
LKYIFIGGNKDLMISSKPASAGEINEQLSREEYDTFDDYLEIVLEFGYLTLFAECFPGAPIFILIVNSIELRSDIFKLGTVFKRPEVVRKRNIGSWNLLIQVIAMLSVFTNLLFTITHSEDVKGYVNNQGLSSSQTLTFFLLEHIVLIVIIFIRLGLSGTTKWVKLFLARRESKSKTGIWRRLVSTTEKKKQETPKDS